MINKEPNPIGQGDRDEKNPCALERLREQALVFLVGTVEDGGK